MLHGIDKGVRDTQVSTSVSYNTLQQTARPISSASATMNVVEGNLALHEIRQSDRAITCVRDAMALGEPRAVTYTVR